MNPTNEECRKAMEILNWIVTEETTDKDAFVALDEALTLVDGIKARETQG